jgi:RNA polymerase sigma factor (sigma-70 family)
MATRHLSEVIQTLRWAALPGGDAGPTDGQLLETYVRSRAEAAFAALVRRHGPMVWGVCRRVLGGYHDAEDAFQATFLVLVRKAASVTHGEKVANWLYGVAHRTALKARAAAARRHTRERQVTAMPEPAARPQDSWSDLEPLLDQELSRLPDKYRAVLVLCDLQGRTRKEAAREFRLPEGTVATRLATARAMLARRLGRHGLALSGGALAAGLSQNVASAGLPAAVASATVKAAGLFAAGQAAVPGVLSAKAVALTEGVLKSLLLIRMKVVTAVLAALAVLGAGMVVLTGQGPQGEPPTAAGQRAPAELTVKEISHPRKEQKDVEPATRAVAGSVKAVDPVKNTLTLANADGQETYAVAPDAEIWIDTRPGQLAGLTPGPHVYATLTFARKTARAVNVMGRHFPYVTVKAVDAAKNTITFDEDRAPPEVAGKTFPVAKDASITIDGNPGKLAGVPPGSVVSLYLGVDQKSVCAFHAGGPVFEGQHAVVVKSVDAARNTVTIDEDRAPPEVAGVTFPVAKNPNITVDGRPARLADIPGGAVVNLTLTVDRKTARVLDAAGPGFEQVVVKAVNAVGGTVTVVLPREGEKTLAVPQGAEVVIDFRPGKLAGLPRGAFANLVLSADRKRVRRLEANGASVAGAVQVVDAGKNLITVAGKTFAVAPGAAVAIDERPGKLAAIPAGADIDLLLSVDQKTAIRLRADGWRLTGIVQAVDVAKGTITVAGKTYRVAKDADIELDRRKSNLADIPRGGQVNPLILSAVDRTTARLIYATRP